MAFSALTTLAARRPRSRRSHTLAALAFAGLITSAGHAHAHMGHTDSAAWQACDDEASSAVCSWENEAFVYRGTCREMSGGLICVRNQPLEAKGQAPSTHAELGSGQATPEARLSPAEGAEAAPKSPQGGPWPDRGWTLGLSAVVLLGALGRYAASAWWNGERAPKKDET